MRFLSLLLISLVAGTGLALLFPAWQECLVTAGDRRQIVRNDPPVNLTLEARDEKNSFYALSQEDADRFVQGSDFQAGAGLQLAEEHASLEPAEVSWTTGSGRSSTTHKAPGLLLRLQVTATALAGQPDDWYDVIWECPALLRAEQKAFLAVHNGQAKWQGDRFLLKRLRVLPGAGARQVAILLTAVRLGLPFTGVLLMILIAVFLLRNSPRIEGEADPASGRLVFPRSNRGVRMQFSVWGGIAYFVVGIFGVVCCCSEANLIDLPSSVQLVSILALTPIPLLAFIVWLMRRRQVEAEVTSTGVTVRRGPAAKVIFDAPWEHIASATPGVRYYRGNIADEWIDLKSRDGRSARLGRNHVQDFPKLREFLFRRVTATA